jgi:hypothetical protein
MDNKFLSQLECTYMLYCLSTPSWCINTCPWRQHVDTKLHT